MLNRIHSANQAPLGSLLILNFKRCHIRTLEPAECMFQPDVIDTSRDTFPLVPIVNGLDGYPGTTNDEQLMQIKSKILNGQKF